VFIFLQCTHNTLGMHHHPARNVLNGLGVGLVCMGYRALSFIFGCGVSGGDELTWVKWLRCHPQTPSGREIIPGPPISSTPFSRSCVEISSSFVLVAFSVSALVESVRGCHGLPNKLSGYHSPQYTQYFLPFRFLEKSV